MASKPCSSAGSDSSFDNGDLEIWAFGAKDIGSRQTATASANDDNIGFSELVEVFEVAACHGTGDLALTDGSKGKAVPLPMHLGNSCVLAIVGKFVRLDSFDTKIIGANGWLVNQCSWWCHFDDLRIRFRPKRIRFRSGENGKA